MCVLHKLKTMLHWLTQKGTWHRHTDRERERVQKTDSPLSVSVSVAVLLPIFCSAALVLSQSNPYFMSSLRLLLDMFCIEFGFKILFIALLAVAVNVAVDGVVSAAVASHIRQFFAASGCHLDYVAAPVVAVVACAAALIIISAPLLQLQQKQQLRHRQRQQSSL